MGLPEVLIKAYENKIVYNEKGQEVPLEANVLLAETQYLYDLCRQKKPAQSLELGFANGMSTLAILQALEDNQQGLHHVIDYTEEIAYRNAGVTMVQRAGLSHRMRFYPKHIEEVYMELPALDFAFIDASHLFDLTLFAFVLIDKKLNVGGLIGLHDMWLPAQRQMIAYLLANRAYTLYPPQPPPSLTARFIAAVLSCLPCGLIRKLPRWMQRRTSLLRVPNLAVIQKQANDKRAWNYHVPF